MTESHTPWLVRILLSVNRVWCRAYHQVDVAGVNCVPRIGAGIVACNHISGLDPAVIQSVIARPVVWMMASEYYSLPVLRHMFKAARMIPVSRDGRDSSAVRAALRALKDGALLGVFPEGKISTTGDILPLQTGLAMLAIRSGAPIYPMRLAGTTRGQSMTSAVLLPQSVRISFGPPLHLRRNLGKSADLNQATHVIAHALQTLI